MTGNLIILLLVSVVMIEVAKSFQEFLFKFLKHSLNARDKDFKFKSCPTTPVENGNIWLIGTPDKLDISFASFLVSEIPFFPVAAFALPALIARIFLPFFFVFI